MSERVLVDLVPDQILTAQSSTTFAVPEAFLVYHCIAGLMAPTALVVLAVKLLTDWLESRGSRAGSGLDRVL